jgi:hypothetical protein
MPPEELMRQFAAVVGGALARRWLRQRGLVPPPQGNSGPITQEAAPESRSPPTGPHAGGDRG